MRAHVCNGSIVSNMPRNAPPVAVIKVQRIKKSGVLDLRPGMLLNWVPKQRVDDCRSRGFALFVGNFGSS